MPREEQKVYLDHLIPREPLLYKNIVRLSEHSSSPRAFLGIRDLLNDKAFIRQLRKPDFQRATQAWTPETCIDLLESVLVEQVVPSVILWMSPDDFTYVLDGGHRISVLLAWIKDNWGDGFVSNLEGPDILQARNTAKKVHAKLIEKGIGSFQEYIDADERYWQLQEVHGRDDVERHLSDRQNKFAAMMRRWRNMDVGFPILWVKGDYEKAEKSFLKINKTGTKLSDWETKLVENRQSSGL